jgi:hypothetical protein
MVTAKILILVLLAVVTLRYVAFWATDASRIRREGGILPRAVHLGIGFVTNFLDTLGIGSFATTTSMYKLWKLVPDEHIPGTLNVGHALAAVAQSFIYITRHRSP